MKNLKATLALGMIFLFTHSFGQSNTIMSEGTKAEKKTAETYLDIMVNMVTTNFNYGESDNALSDFKKSTRGVQAGLSFQAGVTPSFSLVSELYYIRKGGTLKADNPMSHVESTIKLNTIELPVMARYYFGRLYLNAGPSLAYNFDGHLKTNEGSDKLLFNNSSAGYKRLDAGVQVGGGFVIPSKKKRVALDIRYVYGLTDISNSMDMRTRSLMISLHFSKLWKNNPLSKK